MNSQKENITVGEIVAQDFRAAAVFQRFGIDFCCGGKRPVVTACRTASVEPGVVFAAIESLSAEARPADEASEWPVGRLVDHIVKTHHAYIRATGPVIVAYLEKL